MRKLLFSGWLVLGAALFIAPAPVRAADLDKFLPKETDLVISLNVRQILDSSLVKNHAIELIKTTLAGSKEAQEVIKATGLDPLTDLNRVSFGLGLEDITSPKGVVVLEGKLDARKISDAMDNLVKNDPKQYGVDKVSGRTVFKITPPDHPTGFYFAPIDSTVAVAATSKEMLGAAFDAVNGTRQPVIKKDVADLLAKADAKSSLFLVAATKGRLDAIPIPIPDAKKVLDQVHSFTIDLKVEKDVNLELTIGTPDADEAKKLRDLIVQGLDIVKIQVKIAVGQQPELQPLADLASSLTAKQKEKTVVIAGNVTGEALEKLLKK
jgi:hypothetical protein